MRIVFDNIVFQLQSARGISRYFYEVERQLLEWGEVLQFLHGPGLESHPLLRKLAIAPTHIVREPPIPLIFRRYLPIQAKLQHPCIVHSSYYRSVLGRRAALVITVYDFNYERFATGLRRRVHSWQKRRAVECADGIICISESTRRDLLDRYPNVDPRKTRVIYLAAGHEFAPSMELPEWDFQEPQTREALRGKYVLVVGARKHHKNFDVAVEVVRRMSQLSLVMVGGGELTQKERSLLSHALPGRHAHVGTVSSDRLNHLYNRAFCLLYPSSYEGFGIPVVEAMQAGCPVVAVEVSSIPEVGGGAALLASEVDVNQLVNCVTQLEDDAFRQRVISRGFIQAAKFSWEETARQTLAFYREVYHQKFGRNIDDNTKPV